VGVVGKERPGIDGEGSGVHEGGEAGEEVGAVPVILEEGRAVDPPHHEVVERVRGIEARLAGHGENIPGIAQFANGSPITKGIGPLVPLCVGIELAAHLRKDLDQALA
jgi:hypothetical protein